MKKTFDPTKPVQTYDGRKARIICTDFMTTIVKDKYFPILALIAGHNSIENVSYHYEDGKCVNGNYNSDLINISTKHVRYLNLYEDDYRSTAWNSRAEADKMQSEYRKRIACVRIEVEEGQFDA